MLIFIVVAAIAAGIAAYQRVANLLRQLPANNEAFTLELTEPECPPDRVTRVH